MSWMVAMVVGIGGAFAAWFALPWLLRRRAVQHLGSLCAARRAIVLTYDDGPGKQLSPALADLLARHGVKATFFMIGARAVQQPQIVNDLQSAGQEIGSHTQAHLNAWKAPPLAPVRDIRAGRETLARLGAPSALFRPPFGKATLATLMHGWLNRLTFAYWTVDSRDSWETPSSVANVLARIEAQGGGVVLMHDCDAPPRSLAPEGHPDHVLRLTEAIIAFAAEKKFSIVTFGALLAAPAPET